jgi:hypothetical protein
MNSSPTGVSLARPGTSEVRVMFADRDLGRSRRRVVRRSEVAASSPGTLPADLACRSCLPIASVACTRDRHRYSMVLSEEVRVNRFPRQF